MKLSGQHIGFHELRHWYDNFRTQSDQPVYVKPIGDIHTTFNITVFIQ